MKLDSSQHAMHPYLRNGRLIRFIVLMVLISPAHFSHSVFGVYYHLHSVRRHLLTHSQESNFTSSKSVLAAVKIHCAGSCSVHPNCTSFVCNRKNDLCHLYGDGLPTTVTGGHVEGLQYNRLQVNHPTRTEGERNCTKDAHCTKNRPRCVSGICHCEVGWPFDPQKNKCVQECKRYGSGVTIYKGHSITRHNDDFFRGFRLTLEKCQKKCLSWSKFTCKSFDFGRTKDVPVVPFVCGLSKSGYFEVDAGDRWEGKQPWSLGIRHCEA